MITNTFAMYLHYMSLVSSIVTRLAFLETDASVFYYAVSLGGSTAFLTVGLLASDEHYIFKNLLKTRSLPYGKKCLTIQRCKDYFIQIILQKCMKNINVEQLLVELNY